MFFLKSKLIIIQALCYQTAKVVNTFQLLLISCKFLIVFSLSFICNALQLGYLFFLIYHLQELVLVDDVYAEFLGFLEF